MISPPPLPLPSLPSPPPLLLCALRMAQEREKNYFLSFSCPLFYSMAFSSLLSPFPFLFLPSIVSSSLSPSLSFPLWSQVTPLETKKFFFLYYSFKENKAKHDSWMGEKNLRRMPSIQSVTQREDRMGWLRCWISSFLDRWLPQSSLKCVILFFFIYKNLIKI